MNGPEHYAEAERLLQEAQRLRETRTAGYSGPISDLVMAYNIAVSEAGVHATLAHAAATAEAAPVDPQRGPLVQLPLSEDAFFPGSAADPGTPWGRVLR